MSPILRKTELSFVLFTASKLYAQHSQELKRWYDKPAANQNEAFFAIAEVKQPLISAKANLKGIDVKKVYEYDLPTNAGKTFVLKLVR